MNLRADKRLAMPVLLVAMLAVAYWTSSTPLEIAATTTGLAAVWLTARESMWTWPVSLVNVACFFYLFWDVKLYADMTLQLFFFVLSIYGWIVWSTQRGGAPVRPTRRIGQRQAWLLAAALIVITAGWGFALNRYTDASVPYLDALIATMSLIAQWLLSKKVLECWYVWIAVDVLSIGLYFYKDLHATAVLYVVFLGIATMGLLSWKREYNRRAMAAGGIGRAGTNYGG